MAVATICKFSLNSLVEYIVFKLSGRLFHRILPLYVSNLLPSSITYTLSNFLSRTVLLFMSHFGNLSIESVVFTRYVNNTTVKQYTIRHLFTEFGSVDRLYSSEDFCLYIVLTVHLSFQVSSGFSAITK